MNDPMQATGPVLSDAQREKLESRVRLDLWNAVWEASQVMSYGEIRRHVEATIGEIRSNEP